MSARNFPGPWRVEPTEGGHFVVKDAMGFSICYVYARKDEALRSRLHDACRGGGHCRGDCETAQRCHLSQLNGLAQHESEAMGGIMSTAHRCSG